VSDGRREEFAHFGWNPEDIPDPQDPDTFRSARLDWSERTLPEHAGLLAWYRQLIGLRRRIPDLSDPRLERTAVDVDEAAGTLRIMRGSVLVLVNLGTTDRRFATGPVTLLAPSHPGVEVQSDGVVVVPDAVAIVRTSSGRP
jgi:maltooligosyltrehalose trehalohydrolase